MWGRLVAVRVRRRMEIVWSWAVTSDRVLGRLCFVSLLVVFLTGIALGEEWG